MIDNKKLADDFIKNCADFFAKNKIEADIAYSLTVALQASLFSAAIKSISLPAMSEVLQKFIEKQMENQNVGSTH